jgi:hypothetical protein
MAAALDGRRESLVAASMSGDQGTPAEKMRGRSDLESPGLELGRPIDHAVQRPRSRSSVRSEFHLRSKSGNSRSRVLLERTKSLPTGIVLKGA